MLLQVARNKDSGSSGVGFLSNIDQGFSVGPVTVELKYAATPPVWLPSWSSDGICAEHIIVDCVVDI